MLPWIYLVVAGLFEICWAIGLKYTDGFSKLLPSIFTIVTLILSIVLLAKAVQYLPIGTAYSIWVGIGAVGTAILGIILFKEPVSLARIIFILMLLISITGLKLISISKY